MGSKSTPIAFMNPVLLSNSDATKKGKRDGKTTFRQRFNPLDADLTVVFGKVISNTKKIIHDIGSIKGFKYIIIVERLLRKKNILSIANRNRTMYIFIPHLQFKISRLHSLNIYSRIDIKILSKKGMGKNE